MIRCIAITTLAVGQFKKYLDNVFNKLSGNEKKNVFFFLIVHYFVLNKRKKKKSNNNNNPKNYQGVYK